MRGGLWKGCGNAGSFAPQAAAAIGGRSLPIERNLANGLPASSCSGLSYGSIKGVNRLVPEFSYGANLYGSEY